MECVGDALSTYELNCYSVHLVSLFCLIHFLLSLLFLSPIIFLSLFHRPLSPVPPFQIPLVSPSSPSPSSSSFHSCPFFPDLRRLVSLDWPFLLFPHFPLSSLSHAHRGLFFSFKSPSGLAVLLLASDLLFRSPPSVGSSCHFSAPCQWLSALDLVLSLSSSIASPKSRSRFCSRQSSLESQIRRILGWRQLAARVWKKEILAVCSSILVSILSKIIFKCKNVV